MIRNYSNFALPAFHADVGAVGPTLVGQSGGLSQLLPAVDARRAETAWKSTLPLMADVVGLYVEGWSVNRIAIKVGIAWDSAALLLDKAGVRKRREYRRD